MPVGPSAGSRNPFAGQAGASSGPQRTMGATHASQDGADLGSWANGRHSPDAFASLSAVSVRPPKAQQQ